MSPVRPTTLLIAALGGEGGGVLTHWIVSAAEQAGFPVQSTSIPGVAQRTGATTYYIEIVPVKTTELGAKRPVLALTPGVGDIDVAVASGPDAVRDALARQVAGPVRWSEIVRRLADLGCTHVVECGPGKVLAGLVKRIDPDLTGVGLFDPVTLAEVKGLVA